MKKLRKYAVITRISLQNAIAYRAAALSRFGFYTLFIYIFMMLWRAIYKEGSVHGYSYEQMVWYLIFTEFVGFSCGTGIFNAMNEDVKSGAVGYLLGRPVHYVLYQFFNSMGQMLLNFASFGLLAALLGYLFVGPLPGFTLARVPAVLLSVALSLTLHFFFLMLIGLSSFIMEDNTPLFLIYQKLCFMLGMLLPVEFLPAWLQPVAKNLPFSYIFWAPAKLFVGGDAGLFWTLAPRQALWCAVSIGLVFFVYGRSVRRLQVNGG